MFIIKLSKKDDRKDKNLSERFSDDRELIAEMTIMNSDEFMTAVFQGAVEAAQEIVQIVREDKSLKVVDLFSQVTVGQLRRKNARFDVLVMDQNKQIYAFEFQKLDQKISKT